MEPHGWVILALTLATFVGIAVYSFTFGRQPDWPRGVRLKRKTTQGVVVTVINAPGPTPADRAMVVAACALAVQTIFEVWEERNGDRAKKSIPAFAVWFVDDMDERQKAWGTNVAAYLANVQPKASGRAVPMAVIRSNLGPTVVKKGEPVMHEVLHALLGEFSTEGRDRDHSHESWKTLLIDAELAYVDSAAWSN